MYSDKRITQYDVAKSLGVSQATVARVVSNDPNVKSDTRRLVQEKIKELGYIPNHHASSLAKFSGTRKIIKAVLPSKPIEFWSQVSNGINDAVKEIGNIGWQFDLEYAEIFNSGEYINKLEELGSTDYLIVFPLNEADFIKRVSKIRESGTEVIFLNDDIEEADTLFFMGADNTASGRIAGELAGKLLRGRGSVAVISSFEEQNETKERIKGFRQTLIEDYSSIKLNCYYYDITKEDAYEFTKNVLSAGSDISAIYSVDGYLHMVGKALKEMNKEETVLVGHEYYKESKELLENNTIDIAISQNPYKQGYSCVKMLYRYILDSITERGKKYYVDYDIILKHSVHKAKQK